MLKVLVTPTFAKVIKKLYPAEKKVVDQAVLQLVQQPDLGEEKKGDLAGVFVHKFKLNKQEVLLAYTLEPDKQQPDKLVLLNLGSHENFYDMLKRQTR